MALICGCIIRLTKQLTPHLQHHSAHSIFYRSIRTMPFIMQKLDYYSVLGINKSANLKEIKIAYFRLAKKYHPDYNSSPNADSMFEFISEAYEVLSDPKKREKFDEFGDAGEHFGGMSKGPQRQKGDNSFSSEDLFSKIFKQSRENPEDIYEETDCLYNTKVGEETTDDLVANISFEDAAIGCELEVVVNQKIVCISCEGSKAQLGTQGALCAYCEGTGKKQYFYFRWPPLNIAVK